VDIVQFIRDGLNVFQQIEPGVTATMKVGAALGTVGTTTVKVFEVGKSIVTYWFTKHEAQPATKRIGTSAKHLKKRDVAIVVDISRRMMHNVADFLAKNKIDADVLLVTNDREYKSGIVPLRETMAEWEKMVVEFTRTMEKVKHEAGGARIHIFLSTPVSLAFGMGAMWGTVDEAYVYHWDLKKYVLTLKISRRLKMPGRK